MSRRHVNNDENRCLRSLQRELLDDLLRTCNFGESFMHYRDSVI
jgi:hypothetical protein